jgi:hypothetical protein
MKEKVTSQSYRPLFLIPKILYQPNIKALYELPVKNKDRLLSKQKKNHINRKVGSKLLGSSSR